jgi:hypothetical protein
MFSTKSLSQLCLEENWYKVFNYLQSRKSYEIKKKNLMKQDMLGCTCLHSACLKTAPEKVIISMIEIGGTDLVMMKTKQNVSVANTALHYACRNEGLSVNVIKSLLDAGGKGLVLEVNDYGMTALHELCDGIKKRSNDNQALEEKVSMIVKLGGKELLEKKDRNDKTARDIAIMKGASDKVRGMLKPSFILSQSIQTTGQSRQATHGHSFLYDAFLSHNWGLDESGRDNHKRVSKFNEELKKRGFDRTWFDEECMEGNIDDKMWTGIENSCFVIVFVTMQYIRKVAGEGPNGKDDNCRKEFNYASDKQGSTDNIIVVVMEDVCCNPRNWRGPVKLQVGKELYYSFTTDDRLCTCVDEVVQQMKNRIRRSNPLMVVDN